MHKLEYNTSLRCVAMYEFALWLQAKEPKVVNGFFELCVFPLSGTYLGTRST